MKFGTPLALFLVQKYPCCQIVICPARHHVIHGDFCANQLQTREGLGSEAELCQALYAYIANWNEKAGPFQWTATPEEILEKIARTRLSIGASVTLH
jgi:hypothetical protein